MGQVFTKLFDSKAETQTTADVEEYYDVPQTPVMSTVSKGATYCTTNNDSTPLVYKYINNIELDPRSPTVGIYRTPIVVESAHTTSNDFDSSFSIYSTNISNSDVQEIMTPNTPSVNVSGFNETKDTKNDFMITVDAETPNLTSSSLTEKPASIKVRDRPHTAEAKKLLEAISVSDNLLKKGNTLKSEIKGFKVCEDKCSNEVKVAALRTRTPLSNITSSANSPGGLVQSGKILNIKKASSQFGLENSPVIQQLAQWDTNNTVII